STPPGRNGRTSTAPSPTGNGAGTSTNGDPGEPAVVIVALTGRRMGRTEKWPYSGAAALPRAYIDAVVRAGGQPVIVNDARDPKELLARVDALVLTGGPDLDPARYGEAAHPSVYGVDTADDDFECSLTEAALVRSVPTLAICRGIQVLNVARGGTL